VTWGSTEHVSIRRRAQGGRTPKVQSLKSSNDVVSFLLDIEVESAMPTRLQN